MPSKTIIQQARGYNDQPVTATVQIDGVTILQGVVPTLDQSPPQLPDFWSPDIGANAWSWTIDPSVTSTQNMTITVDNGVMYLCSTFYTLPDQPGNVYPLMFSQQQGNVQFSDPFTTITINGIDSTPVRDGTHNGQWVWKLLAGDQFACTVNVVPPPTETPA
jgi:hypothetical protein